jgi:hypothetical protein
VRGGHDGPVQGEVPGLELLVVDGLVAAGDAALHLREVPRRRPHHDERHRLRLEQAADRHHVGRREVRGGGGRIGRRPSRRRARRLPEGVERLPRGVAEERAAADLARDQPVGLQRGERQPDAAARDAEVDRELTFRGQPRAGPESGPFRLGQDQLREVPSALSGRDAPRPIHATNPTNHC